MKDPSQLQTVCVDFFGGGGATLDLTIKKKHEERGLGETFFLYIQPLLLGAGENGEENQEGRRRSQVLSAGSRWGPWNLEDTSNAMRKPGLLGLKTGWFGR